MGDGTAISIAETFGKVMIAYVVGLAALGHAARDSHDT